MLVLGMDSGSVRSVPDAGAKQAAGGGPQFKDAQGVRNHHLDASTDSEREKCQSLPVCDPGQFDPHADEDAMPFCAEFDGDEREVLFGPPGYSQRSGIATNRVTTVPRWKSLITLNSLADPDNAASDLRPPAYQMLYPASERGCRVVFKKAP